MRQVIIKYLLSAKTEDEVKSRINQISAFLIQIGISSAETKKFILSELEAYLQARKGIVEAQESTNTNKAIEMARKVLSGN